METIKTAFNYKGFISFTDELVKNHTSTGSVNQEKIEATRINLQRMQRIYKTTTIDDEIKKKIQSIKKSIYITAITEPWCGDSAQILPVVSKLCELNPIIELKIILRDENTELIQQFNTNGSLSIPKFLLYNEEGEVLDTWGPRPQTISEKVRTLKTQKPSILHEHFVIEIQKFYNEDKQKSILSEFSELFSCYSH